MSGSWNPRSAALLTFLVCLAYAVLRYHIGKGEFWFHLPLWTMNKAFALAGLGLICASYWSGRLGGPGPWPCWLGMLGYGLAAMHTLASLVLMNPHNYRRFYDETAWRLNFTGEFTMLCGIIALVCFTCAAVTSLAGINEALSREHWRGWQKVGALGLWFTLGHVLVMGGRQFTLADIHHWLLPIGWPVVVNVPLPPITLLAVLITVITLIFRVVTRGR